MTELKQSVPTWILAVSWFFAVLEIGVSASLVFSPQSVVETVDLTASGVYYLIHMWAARQFALGFIFAFAAFRKSAQMLTISYVFFLVMFVGDFLVGISQRENSLIIAAVVMCLVSAAMIFAINRKS